MMIRNLSIHIPTFTRIVVQNITQGSCAPP